MPSMWQFLSLLGISCQLMLASDGAKSNVTAFTSYGAVFQPLDPATVPVVDPNNATVLTLCELWENESIPVTPGIEMALRRIRPHFASKNIAFRILRKSIPAGCGDDSIIAVAPALVSMHMNESKTGCSLVIGPSCTETMYNIRGLTMAWDVPVVTSGASGIKFEDKKKTTVLTRFGYTQEDVSLFVVRILDHYNWSTVIMLYDADSAARDFQQAFQQVIQTSRMDLYKKIDFVPLLSTLLEGTTGDAQYMDDILLKLSERARTASPPVVLQVLVSAEKLGMTGPEYAYITTNLIEKKTHGFSDMSFFDDQAKASDHARKLLDSLLVVRMQLPSEHGGSELSKADSEAEFSQFSNAIKTISQQQFNYTYAFNEQVTHLVLGIWDATMMYALAVNATLFAGESIYAGRNVTLRMWGHSFMGIAIECTISKYGDRNFPYYLLDYSESEEMFKPVVFFENEQLKLIDLKPIHWPGNGDEAPLDVPRCGFTGNAAICQKTGMPVYGTILLIISALLVIFGVLGLAFYRIKLSRISDDAWKAKSSDIILRDRRVPKGGSSRSLQKGPDDARTLQSGTIATTKDSRLSSISYVATAYYKENLVAIKNLGVQLSHLPAETVSELRLLRQQQHEHIARFYAFCQDSETQCILTEFCPKGSLTDLIENEAINLDWSFKFSLLNDIANGLQYIHHSAFKSHGRITSNNCLIDGRFVVKISDLGLTSFRLSAVSLQKCAQIHYPELNSAMRVLLWRSPELLRAPMPKNGTLKGDIYSVGILIQQLALRRGPYERTDLEIGQPDISEIVARVRDGLIPPYRPRVPFDVAPPELYSIMLCCWSELPLDRFDCDQLRTQLRRVPGNKSGNLMDNLLGRMEKYAMDLEELVNERTSAFMDEKKRSEELLYQMLPRAVANKLKQGLYVEPEAFESVTIYFSDIVGFTTLSATSTPMEVVDLLNDLYTLFDGVIEAYDVYKVETIGDAYVVVSGLPQRNDQRHCVEIANMSIHVMAAIKAFRIRHKPNETLSLRIGMHTGPCAAGVVGLKMPRYCIFGDSVNIASRLETTSEGMKIHVSLASKNILSWCKDFILEYRGNVDLKGRGMMETYWLHSASELLLTPSKLPVANRP